MNDEYILIKNGTLISKDHDSKKSDLLVRGEKIEEISENIEAKSNWKIIEAEAKIVSSGFIDIHSHCDFHFPFKRHFKLYEP